MPIADHEIPASPLDASVASMEGIGPKRAALLGQLGIETLHDLLMHFPLRHEDRSALTPLAQMQPGQVYTVRGRVVKSRHVRLRGAQSIAEIRIADATGEAKATFFGRGFLANGVFRIGTEVVLTGKVSAGDVPWLDNPDYEVIEAGEDALLHTGRLVPIYPLTEGLSQRYLRRWIWQALEMLNSGLDILSKRHSPSDLHALPSTLPEPIRQRHGLLGGPDALRQMHFPASAEEAALARRTLAMEELIVLQTGIVLERRAAAATGGIAHKTNGSHLKALHKLLPFTLTDEQDRVIAEVLRDMASPQPMRRLVQGDVGSGKTMIALHTIAMAADTACQAAVMAPTEILATQHYLGLAPMLESLGLRAVLLTGGSATPARIRKALAQGEAHVAFGTHALFQQSTEFHRLGLVVIDEQHRFGVVQRQLLADKGETPDLLQLTATPIPRTLALTAYGHLDVSVLRHLPPGRQPIATRHVDASGLRQVFRLIHSEAAEGRQAYIVCPLIEESDLRQAKAAVTHHEALCAGPLAGLNVGLLHGRMSADEKADVMRAFKAGEWDVLVATTVIEVGVDAPNATIMLIEDAHSFSLPQLHQLRGRVGRGAHASHCFLTGKPTTDAGRERLRLFCECSDGFQIAEADLALRGPGAFYGVRQAGLSDLRAASLLRDARLIEDARSEAEQILGTDPTLQSDNHAPLRRAVEKRGVPMPG